MQAISGAPYTLSIEFKQDGEYVVPDNGSVSYTLYDNAGAAVSGQTDISVVTDDSTSILPITIAGSYHTVAEDFEQRTIRVSYEINGQEYTIEEWYYVTALLNYRVRPRDVVVLLGIKEGEVLFDEIDLVQAYFKVSNTLGDTVLTTALASGGITQLKANEAIKITAALDLARVIELKAFRKFGNETSYARFEKIDFTAIRAGLNSALTSALAEAAAGVVTSPSLLVVTNPTNPLTG